MKNTVTMKSSSLISTLVLGALSAAAPLVSGLGCDPLGDEPLAEESSSLTTSTIVANPVPPFPLTRVTRPATDRMLWTHTSNGDGTYQRRTDVGGLVASYTFPRNNSSWFAASAAGNKVLWVSAFPASTELATVDDSGNVVSQVTLTSPGSGFRATGLALASSPFNCFDTDDQEQDYFVTWDRLADFQRPTGEWAVQLIAGDGYVRRTDYQPKPTSSLTALWFGYAADGYETALFRDNTGGAVRYRASSTSTTSPPGYQLSNQTTIRRSGFQAVGMTAKRRPTAILLFPGSTTYNDHILFASYNYQTDGGQAVLAAFSDVGAPITDWTFSLANGDAATAYTWVPSRCP